VSGSTLNKIVNSKETVIEKLINTGLGKKPVLPYNLEQLVSYCLTMEWKFFGLTTKIIKRMAFKTCHKKKLSCLSMVIITRNSRVEVFA